MKRKSLTLILALSLMATGCSTRQVVDQMSGSTAQRLVTLSIDKLISELPTQPLDQLQGSKVFLQSHFIKRDPLLDYATSRLRVEIEKRHRVTWAQQVEDADKIIDVFFTSLGTDQDSLGFSLPIPTVTNQGNEIARVDILAYNMYHGISELYFYIRDTGKNTLVASQRQKAQIRTDKLSLPVITIPVSTLD